MDEHKKGKHPPGHVPSVRREALENEKQMKEEIGFEFLRFLSNHVED